MELAIARRRRPKKAPEDAIVKTAAAPLAVRRKLQ
jgi:hypothetical protein